MNIAVNNKSKSKITKKSCLEKADLFAKQKKLKISNLSIAFVYDKEMEEINNKYLNHEGTTDVITFDYSEEGIKEIDGEIIICIDQAKRQAREYKVKLENEISRLIFHGLLHLDGLDDQTPEERKFMTKNEDEMLSLWYEQIK